MLKMADTLGVLPGGNKGEMQLPDLKNMLSGLMGSDVANDPKMSGLLNMVSDMGNLDDPSKAEELKNKMESFFTNELNLDLSNIESDFSKMLSKENTMSDDSNHNNETNNQNNNTKDE
jgi:hypothetical protein